MCLNENHEELFYIIIMNIMLFSMYKNVCYLFLKSCCCCCNKNLMLYKNNYVNSKILVKSYIRRKLRIKRMYSTMQKSNEPRAAAAAAAIPEENKKRLVLSDSGANMYRQVEDKLGHLKQDDIVKHP